MLGIRCFLGKFNGLMLNKISFVEYHVNTKINGIHFTETTTIVLMDDNHIIVILFESTIHIL